MIEKNFAQQPIEDKKLADWTRLFHTNIGDIDHTPERTKYGIIENQSKVTINDKRLRNPLILDHNVTEQEFIKNLQCTGIYIYSD